MCVCVCVCVCVYMVKADSQAGAQATVARNETVETAVVEGLRRR